MKIYIDYNVPNWNEYINAERSNYHKSARIKRQELDIVRYFTIGKKYTGKYPVKLTFRKYFNDKRQDLDNVRVKGIIDGLVKCGVIENDNLTKVQGLEFIPIFDDEKDGIEVEIEEIKKEL